MFTETETNGDRHFLSNLALVQAFFLYLIIVKICLLPCTGASSFTGTLSTKFRPLTHLYVKAISWIHLRNYKYWNRAIWQLKMQCLFPFFLTKITSQTWLIPLGIETSHVYQRHLLLVQGQLIYDTITFHIEAGSSQAINLWNSSNNITFRHLLYTPPRVSSRKCFKDGSHVLLS